MELVGKLKKQVTQAKSLEEAKDMIENAGMKLTDEELQAVAGGGGTSRPEAHEHHHKPMSDEKFLK